jgi:hypothetical protein
MEYPLPTERDADHLYSIQTDEPRYIWAGTTNLKPQVLMGIACPELVGFFFDRMGNLVEVQKRPLEFLQPSGTFRDEGPSGGAIRGLYVYDERIEDRLSEWQREIDFRTQTITVKRFLDATSGIGITDYPVDYFQQVLDDANVTAEEKESIVQKAVAQWEADGQFVLYWSGCDYWLNRKGEVVAS